MGVCPLSFVPCPLSGNRSRAVRGPMGGMEPDRSVAYAGGEDSRFVSRLMPRSRVAESSGNVQREGSRDRLVAGGLVMGDLAAWVSSPSSRRRPVLRLFCFPHAGG